MLNKNQLLNTTFINRYPEIFNEISNLYEKNKKIYILSFGCSTGEELITLNNLYPYNSIIYGCDINEKIIEDNKKKYKNKNFKFITPEELYEVNIKFDIILCLSVLCLWPEKKTDNYSFSLFDNTLYDLNKFLKYSGYIIIYNSKYNFSDSLIYKEYMNHSYKFKDSGFVTKYDKKGRIIKPEPYTIFKKKDRCNIKFIPDIIYSSLKVNTNNLGDHLQIIASEYLLKKYISNIDYYIDRDTGLNKDIDMYKKVIIILNGWFKRCSTENNGWIPNDKIIPLFISHHIRLHTCPYILNKDSLNYYKKWEPIGCRDYYTKELLGNNNIKVDELSACLVLLLNNNNNKNNKNNKNKIFVTSKTLDILDILPKNIKDKCEFINHYNDDFNFHSNINNAKHLIYRYKTEASLVITTLLHSAMVCLALSIPVIVFYPKNDKFLHQSDKERFSSLNKIIKINDFNNLDNIDWNQPALNIDILKNKIKKSFDNKINKIINNLEIPNIFHYTWKNKNLLKDQNKLYNITKNMFTKSRFYLWYDKDIDDLIYHYFYDYYLFFNNLPLTIMKVDIFRYFILYLYGGIYNDFDIEYKKNISELTNNNICFINRSWKSKNENKYISVHNCWMASPPLQYFWMELIDGIIELYNNSTNKEDVINITGPSGISNIIYNKKLNIKYNISFLDNTVIYQHNFSNIKNINNAYIIHHSHGTWK